jgi:hypothetical protein
MLETLTAILGFSKDVAILVGIIYALFQFRAIRLQIVKTKLEVESLKTQTSRIKPFDNEDMQKAIEALWDRADGGRGAMRLQTADDVLGLLPIALELGRLKEAARVMAMKTALDTVALYKEIYESSGESRYPLDTMSDLEGSLKAISEALAPSSDRYHTDDPARLVADIYETLRRSTNEK